MCEWVLRIISSEHVAFFVYKMTCLLVSTLFTDGVYFSRHWLEYLDDKGVAWWWEMPWKDIPWIYTQKEFNSIWLVEVTCSMYSWKPLLAVYTKCSLLKASKQQAKIPAIDYFCLFRMDVLTAVLFLSDLEDTFNLVTSHHFHSTCWVDFTNKECLWMCAVFRRKGGCVDSTNDTLVQ